MILRHRHTWPTFTLALLTSIAILLPCSNAKDDKPKIETSEFDVPLQPIYWFDDSDNLIAHDRPENNVYVSEDAGANWSLVSDEGQKNKAYTIWPHPHDKRKAYIVGTDEDHWVTSDRGVTWSKFNVDYQTSRWHEPFSFHARDSKKVIFHGAKCIGPFCEEVTFWTDDDFKTVKPLRDSSQGCYWAVGTPEYGIDTSEEEAMENRIFCVVQGSYSPSPSNFQLRYSDDYFKTEQEPRLAGDRPVNGIIDIAAVKKYLLTAAKSEGSYELGLYVSDDATTWHRAEFGDHKLEEDAYTILESTNYSIQVDVMTQQKTAMGAIYASNSNGTYFTKNIEHTNRDMHGRVDFEKIEGIQGIYLANIVDNWEDVANMRAEKRVKTQITFDDGRSFHQVKADGENLHLHSVTNMRNIGRVFSSPAPGIAMGVGNTGKQLNDYEEGDLYVSDDAGVSWRHALDGAHKYEIGNNGAVLVAVDDEEPTNEIRYSTNHGKDWEKAGLGVEGLKAAILTTVPDSTSLKFLLGGVTGRGQKARWHFISIDFGGLHERECGDKDFENWPARVDEDGEPSCLMGHKQFYRRRKAGSECVIKAEFKDPIPTYKKCKCTKEDFECDYNFVQGNDEKTCVPTKALRSPEGQCKKSDDTFEGSSGFRLIPGNECERKGGDELDKAIQRPCADTMRKPVAAEGIAAEKHHFKADRFSEFYYLERTEQSHDDEDDETIVMLTSEQEVYKTKDHGKTWEHILKEEPIVGIKPHDYFNDIVYFITGSSKVHYSIDRGANIRDFETQDPPTRTPGLPAISFHEKYKDYLLWTGARDCPGDKCHDVVTYSTDRGDEWKTLVRYSRKCEFIKPEGRKDKENLIYCEQYEKENMNNPLQLYSSDNWFADSTKHFDDIIGFATMSEFIVVAAQDEQQKSLRADASVDGETFADAEFPKNFKVSHQSAYTVLDSSTHAVFLHVTVNSVEDHEHGAILKSNSNGTSYVMSLDAVNRDTDGFVDFEKMKGLEGVALVNQVYNREGSDKSGEKKKLKTKITHNDGGEWALVAPPDKDAEGRSFGCSGNNGKATDKCSLHLHSFTERSIKSATFGSPSAVGLMIGVGNVGEYLTMKDDESTYTFITSNGGISWKAVMKGAYMWEYGDRGSIIVIVKQSRPTKVAYYSLDEGDSWTEYQFSDVDMQIDAISTVPSDSSMNFLLWGGDIGAGGKPGIATVNIDFTGHPDRQEKCEVNEDGDETKDYYLWEPKHPLQDDNCLFGHIAQYHRKRPKAKCFNGLNANFEPMVGVSKNCECNRQDFECDYNYELQNDGSCGLVPGYMPPNHEEKCKDDSDLVEYYAPTGYRRIPLTTCKGGKELEKSNAFPCPGHEEEFEEKHAMSGVALFFVILIPIALFGALVYYGVQKWKDGTLQGLGQIRLGEGAGSGGVRDSPLVTVPITIIAGTWAVLQAMPLLAMSLWRSARGYMPVSGGGGNRRGGGGFSGSSGRGRPYTDRGAFSARRGEYSGVVEDEDELLVGSDEEEGLEV
ncbi:MAG: hypothetical protein Q9160_004527 [Pyrenula sp. 1 TL-2023]